MAAPVRRRRNRSLGQIPLSSGEIELYSRQDEAARRRRRLLAVREQERRLAQQVTQRYRDNLQKMQRGKSKRAHNQLNMEQQKLLTELHVRYQYSLQNMGTAQRNARLKMLELMEQAHEEKDKWKYNRQVTGKQRTMEAEDAREQEEQVRTARQRQVQQNMERLRLLSGQQRQQASARARREQEVAMQRAKDREEIERLRRVQSPEEVIKTPRPHEKDIMSYQHTRTHCHATTPTKERPVVTVIRHNRKHPTAMRGEEEAKKYSEELDLKREHDRSIAEGQKQTAVDRGRNAQENVASKQQGRQAMEWLALVDKMERRTRGQELRGGQDYSLDAGEGDAEMHDPDLTAERAFARMLELDEKSVELSVFSIETDDDLADTSQEKSDDDEVTEADADTKVKLKPVKHKGSFDSVAVIKAGRPGKNEQGEDTKGKSDPHKRVEVATKSGVGKRVDNEKSEESSFGGQRGNIVIDRGHLQWDSHAVRVTGDDDGGQHRYESDERPEGTDSEEEEFDHDSDRMRGDGSSIQRLESRLQEVLDYRLSKPRDGPVSAQYEQSDPSDGRAEASDRSVLAASCGSQASLSQSRSSAIAASSGSRPSSSDQAERSVAGDDELIRTGHHLDTRRGSDAASSMEQREVNDGGSISDHYTSEIYPGQEQATRLRDDRADPEQVALSDIGGDRHVRVDSSAASSRAENLSGYSEEEREYDEAEHEERNSRLKRSGDHDVVAPLSNEDSAILDRNQGDKKASSGIRDRGEERLPRQLGQQRDPDHLESNNYPGTRNFQALDEHRGLLSSSSITSDHEEIHDNISSFEGNSSRVVQNDEDDRMASESSFAPSQKSLSRLDEVVNARARSLEQRYIDQHMMSFSSSEEHNEDEDKAATIDSNDTHPHVNVSPHDPYRQQMGHQARRRSESAVSVAQYSLPPSDTHSSFDDSFDQLRPGYSDDSFVNELVPMFPKHALPQQAFEDENQVEEEYDVQLVAPNMSRMLTAERRTSLNQSRQFPSQHQPSTDRPGRMSSAATCRRSERSDALANRPLSSSSGSSYSDMNSGDTSVERTGAQRAATRPAPAMATRVHTHLHTDSDDLSDVSSDSGVSSLGFAVQLNLVAGATRRRKNGDDRQENRMRGDDQQDANARDEDLDNESVVSERSFASSSSMSMDAHFNYLASMTSAVGKSLPLHLRIPAMIYGKKDMTTPPTPMDWSESSVSSIATAREDPDKTSARPASRRNTRSSSSSKSSESVLEEQHTQPPVRQEKVRSGESSDSGSTSDVEERRATRVTFDTIRTTVSQLPPPPLGSLNMSRPPRPMQTSDRPLDASQSSSSEQHSDELQSLQRRHLPPPPVGSIQMSQPPPMQNYRSSSDDDDVLSSLSSEDLHERSAHLQSNQHLYEFEEERKHDDLSSDASFSSSFASSRRQSVKKAERILISVKKSEGESVDSDGDQMGKEVSLAEAFQRRHPRFGQRVESHRDKLKRQRDKQQDQKTAAKRDTAPPATDDLPPEKQQLLTRLASGSRTKISSREMKERSRRLYHQLPEVVERKRQEEVMRRRRERLNELREQEKERRLQQKQRRQQRR
ncbi:hypothetical protein GN958_ATG12291 [Phytophthora infestans]|uniref:ALMS motif domain-containing protein n=2 Tax=Phytophthora infestans TaxID=4787 RepID=A0A8S9UH06_PHYIN|nr:hypothetical protein GN958_ATG12291 [Phytophthora infestans]